MGILLIFVVALFVCAFVIIVGIAKHHSRKKNVDNLTSFVHDQIQNSQMQKMNDAETFTDVKSNSNVHHHTTVTTKTFVNGQEVESVPENISEIMDDVKDILKSVGVTNNFSVEKKVDEYVICEYCGTQNESKNKKCSSCGAALKKK